MTIVIAQGVMILTSPVAMRMAEKESYWLVLLVSFLFSRSAGRSPPGPGGVPFSAVRTPRSMLACHCVFPPDGIRVRPDEGRTMKRVRFTEEQIIAVLKEHEAGAKTADMARKPGLSEATIYNLKAKFGGMDVSEA